VDGPAKEIKFFKVLQEEETFNLLDGEIVLEYTKNELIYLLEKYGLNKIILNFNFSFLNKSLG
jgi:hypothetical protein